jgi:hypothetical protein
MKGWIMEIDQAKEERASTFEKVLYSDQTVDEIIDYCYGAKERIRSPQ